MTHQNTAIKHDLRHLAESAESVAKDTCDCVTENLGQASEGLNALRKKAQRLYHLVQDQASAEGRIIHREIQEHSFRYLALAAGLGALLGCLVVARLSSLRH